MSINWINYICVILSIIMLNGRPLMVLLSGGQECQHQAIWSELLITSTMACGLGVRKDRMSMSEGENTSFWDFHDKHVRYGTLVSFDSYVSISSLRRKDHTEDFNCKWKLCLFFCISLICVQHCCYSCRRCIVVINNIKIHPE